MHLQRVTVLLAAAGSMLDFGLGLPMPPPSHYSSLVSSARRPARSHVSSHSRSHAPASEAGTAPLSEANIQKLNGGSQASSARNDAATIINAGRQGGTQTYELRGEDRTAKLGLEQYQGHQLAMYKHDDGMIKLTEVETGQKVPGYYAMFQEGGKEKMMKVRQRSDGTIVVFEGSRGAGPEIPVEYNADAGSFVSSARKSTASAAKQSYVSGARKSSVSSARQSTTGGGKYARPVDRMAPVFEEAGSWVSGAPSRASQQQGGGQRYLMPPPSNYGGSRAGSRVGSRVSSVHPDESISQVI
jgi:hypothetical protein